MGISDSINWGEDEDASWKESSILGGTIAMSGSITEIQRLRQLPMCAKLSVAISQVTLSLSIFLGILKETQALGIVSACGSRAHSSQ